MKNIPDIGVLIVLGMVFGLIFMVIHFLFERLGLKNSELDILVDALIASWAWLCWPRGEE